MRYIATTIGWALFWVVVILGVLGLIFEWDHFYRFVITGG